MVSYGVSPELTAAVDRSGAQPTQRYRHNQLLHPHEDTPR